jgi:hypothetical protein
MLDEKRWSEKPWHPQADTYGMESRRSARWLAFWVAVVCAVLGVAASGASASRPRFHLVAHSSDGAGFGAAASDGVRYVVWPLLLGARLRVTDTVAGTAYEEPAPTAVGNFSSTPQPCEPRGAGDGRLLWACLSQTGSPNLLIQDLRTRAFIRPAGIEALGSFPRYDFFAIGRYWLGGYAANNFSPPGGQAFVNWRTGEARNLPGINHFGDHHTEDLDWSSLERPLCRPLTRPRFPVEDQTGRVSSFVYGLFVTDGTWATYDRPSDGRARLAHCGQRRTAALGVGREDVLLASGWLTYHVSDQVTALRLADRRLYQWGTEEGGLAYGNPRLTHTANRLLASFCQMHYGPDRQECAVYSATLPRRSSSRRR